MEQFYSIQGEGFHQGKAAHFIRLGGCDVGCVWCDVKESWNASDFPQLNVHEMVQEAKKSPAEIVVITGGEPLMHDLNNLTNALKKEGKKTHLETSGAYPLSGLWDWTCISPKKFKAPLPEILPLADELKVVIFHKSDFLWAEKFAEKVSANCKLFLQPEWSKAETMIPLITSYLQKNPWWQISLQIHKYMNVR
jgi:organic radical activating enzyme